ncbi:MAG TPA: MarC family protein [Caulobacteraceae bacterium]
MTIELSFAFTILFVTLGPIKTIPAFGVITADLDGPARRWLAIRATLLASILVFATALIFLGVMKAWRVSTPAMLLSGGLLLFISASRAVSVGVASNAAAAAPPAEKPLDSEARARVLSPLTVPSIVSPIGLVAVLVFSDRAQGDWAGLAGLYALLAGIMALNLVGMLLVRPILKLIGLDVFRVLGWIFAIMQAGLAIEIVIQALQALKVIPV